jgi:hypothetical protein
MGREYASGVRGQISVSSGKMFHDTCHDGARTELI